LSDARHDLENANGSSRHTRAESEGGGWEKKKKKRAASLEKDALGGERNGI